MTINQWKKILINTTTDNIELRSIGITVFANSQIVIESGDWMRCSTDDFLNEIEPLLQSGSLTTNDGVNDITNIKEAVDFWKLTDSALGTRFENDAQRSNGFSALNVQEAIEEVIEEANKKRFYAQYQEIGTLNYTQYLYANQDTNNKRSGDKSNGYKFQNSAPIIAPFSGEVKELTAAIKGVAVSTGTPGSTVTVNFELWKVGFNGEGSKIGDLKVDVDSLTYTVGRYWNTSIDTDFSGSQNISALSVNQGDLLGLKFIRQKNNTNAVAIKNATISITIREN